MIAYLLMILNTFRWRYLIMVVGMSALSSSRISIAALGWTVRIMEESKKRSSTGAISFPSLPIKLTALNIGS